MGTAASPVTDGYCEINNTCMLKVNDSIGVNFKDFKKLDEDQAEKFCHNFYKTKPVSTRI